MKLSEKIALSRAQYEGLISRLEDLEDALEMREIEKNRDTRVYIPAALVKRMLKGEHPVRIWREFRGLSMQALADKSGVSQSYLSEIETGRKPGSVAALKAIAAALDATIDDLVP